MDYGAFPPEFNSARMYLGPGAGSLLAAAAAWDSLAANLRSTGSAYGSVVSTLTDGWQGPSSTAMAAAATPYVGWINATAGQAELAATQARAAASAYQTAFAMTVPPPVIAANRTQLAGLVATNLLGQNTPAIAATQAQYGEMWAQDAAAMYGYAANSAATTANVTPFTAAPSTANPAGLAAQAVTNTQVAGTSAGAGVQSALSQLLSSITNALQSLASPGSSSTSGLSGLSGILNGLLGGSSGAATTTTPFGGLLDTSGFSLGSVLSSYAVLPGFMGMFMAANAISPLLTSYSAFLPGPTAADPFADIAGAAEGAVGAEAAGGFGDFAGGVGGFADSGAWAGLGEGASVGGLSVPPSWDWAASGAAEMLGPAPLGMPAVVALPAEGTELGAGLGFPFMFGGLPAAAAMGAAAGAGGGVAAAKYGPRLAVVARSPAAGYTPEPAAPAAPKYPVPTGIPTNGQAPPGYQPAVIYVPTNGNKPVNV